MGFTIPERDPDPKKLARETAFRAALMFASLLAFLVMLVVIGIAVLKG